MDPHPSNHQPIPQKLYFFPLPILTISILTRKQLSYTFFFLSLLITFTLFYSNIVTPFNPRYNLLGSIGFLSQIWPYKPDVHEISGSKPCDYSYGKWVRDENYSLRSYTENCRFLDPGFRCRQSGRRDVDFHKWRWQPEGCDLQRFNAIDFLERSRNGRIVFAGDSIARNQWESLLCMLAKDILNKSTIFEENGSPITKHKGYLSIRFQEYNLTVEYYRVPFLVVIDRPPKNASTQVRSAIRVDKLHWYSDKWVGANVLIFGAGHWWNEEKTVKMGWHFQEGGTVNMTMTVMEAFEKSLQALKSWALQHLDPDKTIVLRSYSPVHYRNGTWNEGGHCDTSTAPETDYTKLETEPLNNQLLVHVARQMESERRRVQLLNITYLTEFRKDGHPSRYREPGTPQPAPQDCSHWCLPGVPDTWNELLYAQLLAKGFRTRSK